MFRITLRHLVFATIFCSSFYTFTQFAVVYFYVWEFQDFVRDEVKLAPLRESAEEARLFVRILDAARYYNLEIDPKQIKISKNVTISGMAWTTLGVDVTYAARVNLSVFKRPLRFHTIATVVY